MAEEALTSPDLLAVIGARPQFIKSAASTRVLGHFGIPSSCFIRASIPTLKWGWIS